MSEQNSPSPSTSSSTPKPKVFKPRAGIQRKSKAEREEYAKAEAERATARAIAAAQANADREKAAQLQQQQSKSRVKKETRDGAVGPSGTPGGVFGASTGNVPGRKVVRDAGMSELLEGGEASQPSGRLATSAADGTTKKGSGSNTDGKAGVVASRTEGGGSGGGAGSKKAVEEALGFDVDEEVDVEPKRDIERIWISSDEDEDQEVVSRKGKAKLNTPKSTRVATGLRPVRAPRLPEETPETNSSLKARDRPTRSNRTLHDDADFEAEELDEDVVELDEDQFIEQETIVKQDIPSSPELNRRKPGKRSGMKTKDSKTATETVEEKAERLRYKDDIRKLLDEFVTSPGINSLKHGEDTTMNDSVDDQESKMFLFQLPPLVPYLADSENMPFIKEETTNIKKDPDDPALSSNMPPPELSNKTTVPIPTTGLLTANEPLRLPAGRVGQLRVHKSGKVSLDWGGTDMEVRYGTEVNFLQDAVLVESSAATMDDGGEKSEIAQLGTSYALGQVQKKMIVIPDWQKLYD